MPAGLPYFAWIDASETTFGPEHLRWDEAVFSFTLSQEEGDPASLTIVVRRPRNVAGDPIGLLGPGRKIWAWFALDCGPGLVKFRGRLVGIPTSLFEELVTLEFVAKPVDLVVQKEAVAASLRVLPYYDPVVIDAARRTDPDVVLEGYTAIWHYDRETHVITVSDEITGEDGLVEFDGSSEGGKVFYDGLGLSLTSGPLARVDVNAEFTWSQRARGTVDLSEYLRSSWPFGGGAGMAFMNAASWPKSGAGCGDGWTVAAASAQDLQDFSVHTTTSGGTLVVKDNDGTQTGSATWSESRSLTGSGISLYVGNVVTNDSVNTTYSKDGDGLTYASSSSRSYSHVGGGFCVQAIRQTFVAAYEADRPCTELVSFSLFADVQPILTNPEDGEALRIDDIRSANLSEAIDGELPIGDARRRSYIATARGNQSLEHLIAVARAHLMKRARVVEIAFAPKLSRMYEVTLRKSAFLVEPRVGEATGKIIGYSIALDGADGRIKCEVRMGCAIGRGGTVAAADGEPTYCTVDYTGPDYQVFINRTVLFPLDMSVGYEPPIANPNDDGIDFMRPLGPGDVIQVPLSVTIGAETGSGGNVSNSGSSGTTSDQAQNVLADRNLGAQIAIAKAQTKARFKLKSMKREFSSDYELRVTDLKIPTGYDLEAV